MKISQRYKLSTAKICQELKKNQLLERSQNALAQQALFRKVQDMYILNHKSQKAIESGVE